MADKNKQASEVNEDTKISFLFMITAQHAEVIEIKDSTNMKEGLYIKAPLDTHTVVFSDRPFRIAKRINNGLKGFCTLFSHSDFVSDIPNVTFSANLDSENKEYFSIFEMGLPIISNGFAFLPVVKSIGDEQLMPTGDYKNLSLIVDDFGSFLAKSANIAVHTIEPALIDTVSGVVVGTVAGGYAGYKIAGGTGIGPGALDGFLAGGVTGLTIGSVQGIINGIKATEEKS